MAKRTPTSAKRAARGKHPAGPARAGGRRPARAPVGAPAAEGRAPAATSMPVVGMVASAGGLDAFRRFLQKMPASNGMSFVLIPDLDPRRESLMAPLLGKHTAVVEAHEGLRLEPDHVYVIPPNADLAVRGGTLHLVAPNPGTAALEYRVAERTEALRVEAERHRGTAETLREAETSLRAERDLLDAILETVPVVLIVRDAAGRIQRFNRFAERLSGIDSEQALGELLWDELMVPGQAEVARGLFAGTLAGKPATGQEVEWRHRDGSPRTIAWYAARIDSPDGAPYVIATGLDVTDQRAAERDAHNRLGELAALYRLHTANELAATLAHELNQPLTAIASLSEASVALLAAGADGRLAENLQGITAQSLRAGRYINELRRFVARHEVTRTRVDLGAVVRSAAALNAPLAHQQGVRILLGLAELPPVEAAEIQIEHVITNLLRNAIEAIVQAGLASGEVRIGTRATPDGMACVTVADSGPGVPAEQLDRLFEPFFTTKPDGLGMGLRVSRTIVTAHGGRIWAEPGPGGVFAFTVPLAK